MSVPVIELDGVVHEVGEKRAHCPMLPVYTLCGIQGWSWIDAGHLQYDVTPTCLLCALREQPTEV